MVGNTQSIHHISKNYVQIIPTLLPKRLSQRFQGKGVFASLTGTKFLAGLSKQSNAPLEPKSA
jgi:hypothetical protein